MTITFDGFTTTGVGATTTAFTINKPTGVVSGSLLLLQVTYGSSSTVFTPPSGWTALATSPAQPVGSLSVCYYKIAGGSEPASYTGSFNAADYYEAGITTVSGVDPTTPFDPATGYSLASSSTTGATLLNTSMSPVTASGVYVTLWGGGAASGVLLSSLPANTTKLYDANSSVGLISAFTYEPLSAAGAVGSRAFTFVSTESGFASAVVLNPLAPLAPPLPWRAPMIFTRL